ncbi:hypothetical protein TNCT_6871 [Trichonephila clavata]|uniref:Uncharacterized protein n=1 Tax=Trichonephila clavata TaxID=2740835 RepID=A0A8X6HMV2_TRICU|nr:hypothetical protein TNCT_6871 [Trichonephila clavata]
MLKNFFFSEPFLNGIIPYPPAAVSTWPKQNGKGFVPTSLSSVLLEEKGYNLQWSSLIVLEWGSRAESVSISVARGIFEKSGSATIWSHQTEEFVRRDAQTFARWSLRIL